MDFATDIKGTEQKESFLFEEDLALMDPEAVRLIELEDERQLRKIILIASESLAPLAVRQALDTTYTNLYAEGYPSTRMVRSKERPLMTFDHHLSFFRRYYDRRYYKGCDYINFVESLCKQRAAALFATDRFSGPGPKVKPEEIFANVQALLALFVFLGYAEIWAWLETRDSSRLIWASIFMGAACSSKLNALIMGLAPCTALLAVDAIRMRSPKHLAVTPLFPLTAAAWLLPWWIANWIRRCF